MLNLEGITKTVVTTIEKNLDASKYRVRVEAYSWCVNVYICNLDWVQLHEININRFNNEGDFGIGVPDYDRTRYLVKGNLTDINDDLIKLFFNEWNKLQDYEIKNLKEQVCEYEGMKFGDVFK